MSADNGYVVRLHPDGGFAIVEYSASCEYDTPDGYPMVDPNRHQKFNNIKEVFDALNDEGDEGSMWPPYYSEYGYHFDSKVQAKLAEMDAEKESKLIEEWTKRLRIFMSPLPRSEEATKQFLKELMAAMKQ